MEMRVDTFMDMNGRNFFSTRQYVSDTGEEYDLYEDSIKPMSSIVKWIKPKHSTWKVSGYPSDRLDKNWMKMPPITK